VEAHHADDTLGQAEGSSGDGGDHKHPQDHGDVVGANRWREKSSRGRRRWPKTAEPWDGERREGDVAFRASGGVSDFRTLGRSQKPTGADASAKETAGDAEP
jgi:hypothetical protein